MVLISGDEVLHCPGGGGRIWEVGEEHHCRHHGPEAAVLHPGIQSRPKGTPSFPVVHHLEHNLTPPTHTVQVSRMCVSYSEGSPFPSLALP